MGRCALEVADIFRAHGPAWRQTQHGHLSLGQLKVMSAIEQCRSAALGGHVLRCEACAQTDIAYNSCLMVSILLRGVRVRMPTWCLVVLSFFPFGSSPLLMGFWLL